MQRTFFERTKLVAGAVLVTLGILILQENLCRTAVQLSDLLGRSPQEALGALPSIILGASKLAQGYAAGHQQFLEGILHKMAVSSWPLLLVVSSDPPTPEEAATLVAIAVTRGASSRLARPMTALAS